jgi:hypothetical protein
MRSKASFGIEGQSTGELIITFSFAGTECGGA